MPIHDLPPLLWLAASLMAIVVMAIALFRSFRAPAGELVPLTGMLRWLPLILLPLMAAGAFFLAPAADKGLLALVGILAGGLLGWGLGMGPASLFWRDEPARDLLARWSVALVGLVALDALVPDAVLASYAVMGGLLGMAVTVLPLALAAHARAEAMSATLALVAVAGAGLVWGDRALAAASLGSAWALALAALVLLLSYGATHLPRLVAPFAAAVVLAALAAPLGAWGFRLSPQVLWPSLLGFALAAVLALLLVVSERIPTERSGSLPMLAMVLVAGGCLLLANRLFGMFGVTLAGIGLSVLLLARGRAPMLAGILVAGFAGRAFLQLFLDRTYLNQYGVDLTHTYTSFGLVAAFLVPFALVALRRDVLPSGLLLAIEALLVLVLPVLMGYFIHVDPLASYLAGLLVTLYVLGILSPPGFGEGRFAALMPPLLISASAVSLLAAPWLITVLNAPRQDRLTVFAVVLVLLLAYLVALTRGPSTPQADAS